ncbi:FAD-dependent oxidoreductase [bacterium]|nr:FAD-dependent oxidoreductase [bacterium]
MTKHDFVIIGAGIFGITAAIELRKQNHSVGILNPDTIPHPFAASTDISKAVRMEYGTDIAYMEMVEVSIQGWRAWNEQFDDTLYHEVGFLLVCREPLDAASQSFEAASFENLMRRGYHPERLDSSALSRRFPAFDSSRYVDGFYNPVAGYAEAARVVETLAAFAQQLGVKIYLGQTAEELVQTKGRVIAVKTREDERFATGHAVVCAGPHTPYLIPDLKPYMRVTGHPVFHLKASQPELFTPPRFAVFGADISNTGWYGFPLHSRGGVVKIANHGIGVELDPEHDERVVTAADTARFRRFLAETLPSLAKDPIVYTRRCLYTDTLDGHFWIDRHPGLEGLTIGTGGSGHALKMAPILGSLIATAAEGGSEKWSERFRWRELAKSTNLEEEARHVAD